MDSGGPMDLVQGDLDFIMHFFVSTVCASLSYRTDHDDIATLYLVFNDAIV